MSQRIYLDYNATTPLSKLVKAELLRLLELDLGNPSSRHWAGTTAAEIVELSRIRVASLIGCDPTEIIFTSGGTEATRIENLRDHFWERLRSEFGERVHLNGHPIKRLPNTLNVSFDGITGYDVLAQLPFLAASTGSACHAGKQHLSPVLSAMGLSSDRCTGAIRFSLGRETTAKDVELALKWLVETVGLSAC
jgi:cysteine desulfurase